MDEATREKVVAYVKQRSPEPIKDKRISKALDMPVKVVRSCLHFTSDHLESELKMHFRDPYNMRRKRPVWTWTGVYVNSTSGP